MASLAAFSLSSHVSDLAKFLVDLTCNRFSPLVTIKILLMNPFKIYIG